MYRFLLLVFNKDNAPNIIWELLFCQIQAHLMHLIIYFTFIVNYFGGIAQLVEHLPCKQGVSGSIPLTSTKRPNCGRKMQSKDTRTSICLRGRGLIAQLVRAHA